MFQTVYIKVTSLNIHLWNRPAKLELVYWNVFYFHIFRIQLLDTNLTYWPKETEMGE